MRSADGLTPREQLRRIGEQTQQIATRHARVFLDSVRPRSPRKASTLSPGPTSTRLNVISSRPTFTSRSFRF
ncbi:putative polyphosphate kinase [Mycobacterium xenopi 4042]|uniref:Putative polyphosphate kinase n=1 Tax=Mycobacterium xenopi 4042 TaxID=1299334 RepID=X7Z5L7_MYCXE|nr:putative polyphosphate kinase [Mycobacterium xenopi 4042]